MQRASSFCGCGRYGAATHHCDTLLGSDRRATVCQHDGNDRFRAPAVAGRRLLGHWLTSVLAGGLICPLLQDNFHETQRDYRIQCNSRASRLFVKFNSDFSVSALTGSLRDCCQVSAAASRVQRPVHGTAEVQLNRITLPVKSPNWPALRPRAVWRRSRSISSSPSKVVISSRSHLVASARVLLLIRPNYIEIASRRDPLAFFSSSAPIRVGQAQSPRTLPFIARARISMPWLSRIASSRCAFFASRPRAIAAFFCGPSLPL